ncbi:hemin uptake protein HemP [Niveibacterium terrae]|uniref:hemin uptake protein HemP n=1 Tax=Niveibacterium terrae TaxID=3373598 RepID=UPI003A937485
MSTPAPNPAPLPIEAPRTLSSAELLRGETTLVIEHQGMRYTLRATRSGKLILTK